MMSSKYVDRKNSVAQTKIRVTPAALEEEVKVWSNNGTQTYASAKPTSSDSSILSLLKFVPYQDLVKNSIRQVDLPHKTRLIWSIAQTNDENFLSTGSKNPFQNFDDESIQGVLRKGSLNKRLQYNSTMSKSNLDADIQTNLSVTPHVLEEDEVATVHAQILIQTSLTFTPDTSISDIIPKLKENLEHQEGISASEKADSEKYTTDEIQLEIQNVEAKIEKILDRTVTNLQRQLDNILKIYETSLHEAVAEEDESEEKVATLDEGNEEKTEEPKELSEIKADIDENEEDQQNEVATDEKLEEEDVEDKKSNKEIVTNDVNDTNLPNQTTPEDADGTEETDLFNKAIDDEDEVEDRNEVNEESKNEAEKKMIKYDTFDEDSNDKLLDQTVIEIEGKSDTRNEELISDDRETGIDEVASGEKLVVIENEIEQPQISDQISEHSQKAIQSEEIPWFCRCEQERMEEERENSEAIILEIINKIDSSIVLPKPGHKHCDVQTEEVICECTGTNFVEGDTEATRFNAEGTGSVENSCQCSFKVNASIQDGIVKSEPFAKNGESYSIPCECSLSDIISEGQGDQISRQSSFIECNCDQKSEAKDQVSQQGDGPTVEEEEFGSCDCSDILSKETLSKIISQLCNCSICECKEAIESILNSCEYEEVVKDFEEDTLSSICDCEEEVSIQLSEKEAILSLASNYEIEEEDAIKMKDSVSTIECECEEEIEVKVIDSGSTIECECEENEEKSVKLKETDSTIECDCEENEYTSVKLKDTDSTIECECEESKEESMNRKETESTIVCECDETNSDYFQKKLSAFDVDDKEIHVLAQNLSFNSECNCSSVSLFAVKEQSPLIPGDHLEPLSGDNKGNKKRNVILCECHPTVAGAAPPVLQTDDEQRPEAYPNPQSLERLCQENPNNALAFVQRLQVCALTPEGRDYIRNLDPETLQYLIQVGYKDEITKLLQDVPSYYVFKTDPVYAEDYMKNLVISDGPAEILQNESNLSLVPDPNEVSACTKGVELPWFRIKLPEAGTYELKQVEKKPKESESQIVGAGDLIVPETEDAKVEEAVSGRASIHEILTEGTEKPTIEEISENIPENTEDFPQSVPAESAPEESVPDENIPEEAAADEKVTDENAPNEEVSDENVAIENAADENAPDEEVPDENAEGEEVPVENVVDDEVPDENVAEENAADENAADENITDENAVNEEVPDENVGRNAADELEIASGCASVDAATGEIIQNVPEDISEAETAVLEPVQEDILTESKVEPLTAAPPKKHPLLAVAGKPIYFEPYLENLQRLYASDDDDEEECTSKTEMPWKDILLRTNCQIIPVPRKITPKPIQTEEEEEEELCVCEVSDEEAEDADDESCECDNDTPKDYENCICDKLEENKGEQRNTDDFLVTCAPITCKPDETTEYIKDECVCATESTTQPDVTTCTPTTCQDRLDPDSDKLTKYLDDNCTCAADAKLKKATSAPVDVVRKSKRCPIDLGPGIKTCKSLGFGGVGNLKPVEGPKEFSSTNKTASLSQQQQVIETKTPEREEQSRKQSTCKCSNVVTPPKEEKLIQPEEPSVCKCSELLPPPKIDLKPVKLSCSCNKTKPDPVLSALEAYQAEMKPLRETLNKLREKIRDLNLPEMNTICGGNKTNNIDDLFATNMYGPSQLPSSSSGYVSSSVRLNNVRNARTTMQIKRHPSSMPQPGMVRPNGRISGMPQGFPPGMPMGLPPYFNPMGFQGFPPQPNFQNPYYCSPDSQHDFVSAPYSNPYPTTYCDSATTPAMEDKACSCNTSKTKIKKTKKKKKKKIREMASSTEASENESCRCAVALPQPEQDVNSVKRVSDVKFMSPCEECNRGYVDLQSQEGPPGRYRMKIALRLTAPDGTITTPKPIIMYQPQIASDGFSKTGSTKTFTSKSSVRIRSRSNSRSKSKTPSVTVKQNICKDQNKSKETNENEPR